MTTMATQPRVGEKTTGRNALTGRQLELVIRAAHAALLDKAPDEQVSISKVNRMVRRFADQLRRSRQSFYGFLSDEANRNNPIVHFIAYPDPVGNEAARNVDRERGWR